MSNINARYSKQLHKLKNYNNSERLALLQQYVNNKTDTALYHKVILANLKLSLLIAARYSRFNFVDIDDIVQEGNVALMYAVKTYNPKRGNFTTYTTFIINKFINNYVKKQGIFINIPLKRIEQINKLNSITRTFVNDLHRSPTTAELAHHLHLSQYGIEKLSKIVSLADAPISLSQPLSDDSNHDGETLYFEDTIPDPIGCPQIIDQADLGHKKDVLNQFLPRLKKFERTVVTYLYGLNGHSLYTMDDISKKYRVSKEWVRQVRDRALQKLKKYCTYAR